MIDLVNWQQEEPNGCGGGRQPSVDGTSRISREAYVRFCERLRVQFPGPTRRFECEGRVYRSLSAAVRVAVGTRWNGFAFFGLGGKPGRKRGEYL